MRIVVNDIAASKGGALTVLKDFYSCVRENDTENEWIFLLGGNILEETDNIKIITLPQIKGSRVKKLLFDLFTGKRFMNKLKPDVILSLQNTITFGAKAPQVLYLHHSVPFQTTKTFSFFKGSERALAVYQHLIGRVIKRSVKKCHKVIVQTKWMQEAVMKQCRLPEDKIMRVAPTVADLSAYNTNVPFNPNHFFYPTAQSIYKNNAAIFKACDLLNEKGIHCDVALTLPEQYGKGDVHCVGRLPYSEVIEKYAESTLLSPPTSKPSATLWPKPARWEPLSWHPTVPFPVRFWTVMKMPISSIRSTQKNWLLLWSRLLQEASLKRFLLQQIPLVRAVGCKFLKRSYTASPSTDY